MVHRAHLQEALNLLAKGDVAEAREAIGDKGKCSWSDKEFPKVVSQLANLARTERDLAEGAMTSQNAMAQMSRPIRWLADVIQTKLATAEVPEDIDATDVDPERPTLSPADADDLPAALPFEKIIGSDNLQRVAWLQIALDCAKSVARICTPQGRGTGWVIAPGWLMTNHHVIGSADVAGQSVADFNFQTNAAGEREDVCRFRLLADGFRSDERLDYALVQIEDGENGSLADWQVLTVDPDLVPLANEHVSIIQHPGGGYKKVAITANQVANVWSHRLQYTTDTMPGSSGSPVFNDSWDVVAIHHAGGNLPIDIHGSTRYLNEGILMRDIKAHLGANWPA